MPFDSLGRRSRFRRTPLGKRVVPGARDVAILQSLHRYRYLYHHQLLALLRPKSEKRFIERLGDLFHETGLIDRLEVLGGPFSRFCVPTLYTLTASGYQYLERVGTIPHRAVTFSLRASRSANPQLLHKLMIVRRLVEIELACRASADQRFVPVDEIIARAPCETQSLPNPLRVPVTLRPSKAYPFIRARRDTHLIPDALYGIEYKSKATKRYRFWALECERTSPVARSTVNASSTRFKRAAYDALISSGAFHQHWGIPNLKLDLVTMGYLMVGEASFLLHSPKSSAGRV